MPYYMIFAIVASMISFTWLGNEAENKLFPSLGTNSYCLSLASESPQASTKMVDSCRHNQQEYIEKSKPLFDALTRDERWDFKNLVDRKKPMSSKEAYEILERSIYSGTIDIEEDTAGVTLN